MIRALDIGSEDLLVSWKHLYPKIRKRSQTLEATKTNFTRHGTSIEK